mgnify:CR=1 FL=1
MGADSIVVAPANAGFFALGLALLQGILPLESLPENFSPKVIIYVAPPFRQTHFGGKQIVVHNRRSQIHELFSYNLYPGPSAKKGVYGVLINTGEREGWVTAHCSTVRVATPYDNEIVVMHEGASGGKSEMLEYPHRESDGRMLLGKNIISGEHRFLEIPRTCQLQPVTDDMALCHSSLQSDRGKLVLTDAEAGWFVRVNHITRYGTDLNLESLTACPSQPLLFLNIDAVAGSRAMIWEHIQDAPGKPCPNPPRHHPPRHHPARHRAGCGARACDGGHPQLRRAHHPPAPARTPPTASSASCMFCLRPSHGCGVWWLRAAMPTPASWAPKA